VIIRWLEDAIVDLQALRQYIAQDNPIAANRVSKKILSTLSLLSTQPEIGRPGRVPNTRELVISNTPYIIPYRVKNDVVEVIRVLHSSMQWPEQPVVLQGTEEVAEA
jgi:toxin ParE1/3/4